MPRSTTGSRPWRRIWWCERFGNAPKSDDEVRRYATGVVDVLLSGISTGA